MDQMMASIILFSGNFAPRGWSFCHGQLLAINQYTALFSLLGTTYGGDGRTSFALPDLRGRVPVGQGQGPGLSKFELGEKTGNETASLTVNNLPPHNHNPNGQASGGNTTYQVNVNAEASLHVSSANATHATAAAGDSIAITGTPGARGAFTAVPSFNTSTPDIQLNNASIAVTAGADSGITIPNGVNTGTGLGFSVQNPILGLNYIICIEGIYPSRP